MPTHTSNIIPSNVALYEERAAKIDLIWCQQIIDLIKKLRHKGELIINDIGCNYGQLYKEIKRRGLKNRLFYRGYDIDTTFLEIGKRYFPEITKNFECFDIESSTPKNCDITICSAVFEHLDKPKDALIKMLQTSKKALFLRTMVGSSDIEFIQSDPRFVNGPYNINQFNLFDLCEIFFEFGYDFTCIPDRATNNSKEYELFPGTSIVRQIYIIQGMKN